MTVYQTMLFINSWMLWIVFLTLAYKLYKRDHNTKTQKLMCFTAFVLLIIDGKLLLASGFYNIETTTMQLYRNHIMFLFGIVVFSVLTRYSRPIIYRIFIVYKKGGDSLWHFHNPINKTNIYLTPLLIQFVLLLITVLCTYYYIVDHVF